MKKAYIKLVTIGIITGSCLFSSCKRDDDPTPRIIGVGKKIEAPKDSSSSSGN